MYIYFIILIVLSILIVGLYMENPRGIITDKARTGDLDAQLNLGAYYFRKRRYDKARYWFDMAAGTGDALGCFNLGIIYYGGWGVARDLHKALAYFTKAADQNLAGAQHNLGVMHYEKGPLQDYAKALFLV